MSWQKIQYLLNMAAVLWSFLKDLIVRNLPYDEVSTNYLLGKANAFERANLPHHAVRVYQEILDKDKKSVPVLLNLGGLYYRKGRYDAALPYYEKVVQMNPKHYQGHYWLAMCYLRLGRYYAAINTLEAVIEYLPTFKDALNLIGECYERIGEGAKAEHYYLKAISADPNGIVIPGGMLGMQKQERKEAERVKH